MDLKQIVDNIARAYIDRFQGMLDTSTPTEVVSFKLGSLYPTVMIDIHNSYNENGKRPATVSKEVYDQAVVLRITFFLVKQYPSDHPVFLHFMHIYGANDILQFIENIESVELNEIASYKERKSKYHVLWMLEQIFQTKFATHELYDIELNEQHNYVRVLFRGLEHTLPTVGELKEEVLKRNDDGTFFVKYTLA